MLDAAISKAPLDYDILPFDIASSRMPCRNAPKGLSEPEVVGRLTDDRKPILQILPGCWAKEPNGPASELAPSAISNLRRLFISPLDNLRAYYARLRQGQ
jgi:hypothetical protein